MTGEPARQAPDWLSLWNQSLKRTIERSKEWMADRAIEARAHAALKVLRDRGHLEAPKRSS